MATDKTAKAAETSAAASKKFDMIGVENLIMDMALQIDRIPKTDGFTRMHDFLWSGGGNIPSAVVACARLGGRAAILGCCGTDAFGDFNRDDMVRHGVDVSHLYRLPGNTTFVVCLAEGETQGRSFIGLHGVDKELTPEEVGEDFIASSRYIHIGMGRNNARKYAVEFARKHGVLVSSDAGGFHPGAEDLVGLVDILVMSEGFYNGYFGAGAGEDFAVIQRNCAALLERGPMIAVVTLGARGCVGADAHGTVYVPPFSGYQIVDTTGAGDVYHGAFVYAHAQGWGLEQCMRFSSAVSYINCTSLGCRIGIPNRPTVDKFLASGVIDYTEIEPRRAFYRGLMKFEPKMFG